MLRRHHFLSLLLVFFAETLWAQEQLPDSSRKDLIDYAIKILKISPRNEAAGDGKKVRLSLVPFSTGSDRAISISTVNLAFYRGDPATTNLSTVYFYPYTNFSGRYSFRAISNIWSEENKYSLTGDFRISSNNYEDYGIGSDSHADSVSQLDYNHSRFHLQLNRLVYGFFYAGAGYALDYYSDLSQPQQDVLISDFQQYPYGTGENTTSSGITLNVSRDSRKNIINPQGGFFTGFLFRLNRKELGSSLNWNSVTADIRKYFPLTTAKRSVLALRILYWDTWGQVPYLDLPATMTDRESRVGRGYYYSRFRGTGMAFGEAEYRFTISRNQFLGAVLFVNGQSLREDKPGSDFGQVNPAAGFGLRLKFNKRSDANVTLDFAFGKNSFNWYLNLGEFF